MFNVSFPFSDEVEFEVDTDSAKGKLIARRVVLLPSGTVSFERISEERLLGKVDQEPTLVRSYNYFNKTPKRRGSLSDESDPGLGRIIYERKGVS